MARPSSTNLAAALRSLELSLGVQYPPTTLPFLEQLSMLLVSPHHERPFRSARLLLDAEEIATLTDENGIPLIESTLLPFLADGSDLYGFNLKAPSRKHIALYAGHSVVKKWSSPESFLHYTAGLNP